MSELRATSPSSSARSGSGVLDMVRELFRSRRFSRGAGSLSGDLIIVGWIAMGGLLGGCVSSKTDQVSEEAHLSAGPPIASAWPRPDGFSAGARSIEVSTSSLGATLVLTS